MGNENGLNFSEWMGLIGVLVSILISAAAGFISWGANNARVDSLNNTVVNLTTTVINLNQTLQQTREQLGRIEERGNNTDKNVSDLKSNFNDYIKTNPYRK